MTQAERDALYDELIPVGRRIARRARCPWYMEQDDFLGAVLLRLVQTIEGVEPVPPGLRVQPVAVRRMQEEVRRERDRWRRWQEWKHVLRTGVDFSGHVRRAPQRPNRGHDALRRRNAEQSRTAPRRAVERLLLEADRPTREVASEVGCCESLVRAVRLELRRAGKLQEAAA